MEAVGLQALYSGYERSEEEEGKSGSRMSTLEKYKTFWKEWQVQLCIMCSLLLQIFLFFFASFRKRKTRFAEVIRSLIWLAYLVADVMATYSLALISNTIGHPKGKIMDTTYEDKYNDLLAFWAPFLLIHLGGPDSITAHAVEDNELWLRHSLFLVARLFACGYIFVRSFPNQTLIIPTVLLLVAGTIKYLERTVSLYLASNHGFKESASEENDQQPRMKRLEDFIRSPPPLSSQDSTQKSGG
ncbi:hypothetical protein CKAN_01710400 [Cinnamomum micranthum f. kanehirae]|uniref:DUF4220 domain-containing protein n=1 Tax=Cinnamomum micranthum f. kanehirae TaxID=337451 RepID=A0A3S3PD54_9MAGN|nr:hypothetical protein CKAN_01710400 [Cinnamomum micranthum f. kanehirae]